MAVYVDNMRALYKGMRMSHMIADFDEELHQMANKIGVSRRWFQGPPDHDPHYDIAASKVSLAVSEGAMQINTRQLAAMNMVRRMTGFMPLPNVAEEEMLALMAERREEREKLITKDEAGENSVPIKQMVYESRRFVSSGILTREAFDVITQLSDKLQWLAKGYGLWGTDDQP